MGGFSGLAVEAAEKGLAKIGGSVASSAAKDLTEFAGKEFGFEQALKSPKPSAQFLKGMDTAHVNETTKNISQISQNLSQHFVRPPEQVSPAEIRSLASQMASDKVYLKNQELLVGGLDWYRREHGEIQARNLSEQYGIRLHEQAFPLARGGEGSKLQMRLQAHPLTKDVQWPVSPYKAPATIDTPRFVKELGAKAGVNIPAEIPIERMLTSGATGALAQKTGFLHAVSGPLNLFLDSSLRSAFETMGGLFTNDRAGFIARAQAMGALGEYALEKQAQIYQYENGILKKLPGEPIWRALQGNLMMPGVSAARKFNIINFGHQGELEAKYLARDLLSGSGSRAERARYYLSQYGLDYKKIERQGGLLDDDLRIAIDTNVRRKLMTETGGLRYKRSAATPIGRLVNVFHSYAVGQRNFLLQTFRNSIKARDPMRFVKDAVVLSLIFPDVGAGMRYVGDVWSGKDEKEARDRMEQTWRWSISPDGYTTGKAWADRMDAMMHLTGLGIMTSYLRAAHRHQLMQEFAGAVAARPFTIVEDMANAASGMSSTPLKRDILHSVPSMGAGAWLSTYLYPPQTSATASRRASARAAAERRRMRKEFGY